MVKKPFRRKKRPARLKVYIMDDGYAFIQDPEFFGRWVRVPACVALYGCPVCKAKTGEPCKSRGRPWGGESHYQRRMKTERLPTDLRGVTVVS